MTAAMIIAAALGIAALAAIAAVARLAWGFYRLSRYATMESTRHAARMGLMAALVFLAVLALIAGRIALELARRPITAEAAP